LFESSSNFLYASSLEVYDKITVSKKSKSSYDKHLYVKSTFSARTSAARS